jgi:hypothetical protein
VARALALDVSDAGVLGVAEGGALLGPSPGYALVEGETRLVGEEARRRARLKPRFVVSRFWERLDTEPLGRPFPDGLHAADLVHAHLASLWSSVRRGTSEVILAAPGFHRPEALGRLVGIAQSLEMPVVGLVDTAVAAASAGFPGERLLVVDVHLHRATVTELRQDGEIVRERVAVIDRWGLDDLSDVLARGIAERFVRATRFDPLHAAETEQQLVDRLPGWLERLGREERAAVSLSAEGSEHEIELARSDVEEWSRGFGEELAQEVSLLKRPGEPATAVVVARAARLPGLVGRLAAMKGVEVRVAPEHAAAAGALREREAVRGSGGELRFVTRLRRREPAGAEGSLGGGAIIRPPAPRRAPAPAAASGRRPTHLLLGHAARPLTAEPLVVGTAPPEGARGLRLEGETAGISRAHCRLFESGGEIVLEDLSTWGTFVNGERVAGRLVLLAGDRVRVGSPGIELVLIASEE